MKLFRKENLNEGVIWDSLVIYVEIGNIDFIAGKMEPQKVTELIQKINNYIEAKIEKYNGVVFSYMPGSIITAIPITKKLDSVAVEILLKDLYIKISEMFVEYSVPRNELILGIGANSGKCVVAKSDINLILGMPATNAHKICRYAIAAKEKILIASNVIDNWPELKDKATEYGVALGTDIKVWKYQIL